MFICDISGGAVITIRPGAFRAVEAGAAGGTVIDKTADATTGGLPGGARRYIEVVQAEVGDVDITKSEILVSVGRGIGEQENIDIIKELAKAVGGDVSCSRPIVDAKWLEKSRQVGTSGQTVKAKSVHGSWYKRFISASWRNQGFTFYGCCKQESQSSHLSGC